MGQSQLIEIAIGVVFVWFILSMLLSVVNEGLALVFRIRAKHLWLAVGRVLRPKQSQYARKILDTIIRLPFKPSGLDQRPVAQVESADAANTKVQKRPVIQAAGSVEAELQRLYNAAAPMLTDVAAVGRRSKLTDLSAKVFSEAIASLAHRVHPADLVTAANSLGWSAERVAAVETALAATPPAERLDVAAVTQLSIPDVTTSDKETLFTNASTSLTPRDLVDFFDGNPGLKGTVARAIDASGADDKLQAGKAAIEQWYDREMDRLSAMYRRQNRKVLLLLSIPVVLLFRANTIGMVRDLTHDASLRQALTNGAVSVSDGSTLDDAIKNTCGPAPSTTPNTPPTTDPFKAAVEKFSCAGKIVQSAEAFGFTPAIGDLLHPSRWSVRGAWHWVIDDYGLIGRAITLVALMFGAQFWFDILRRLVGIRSKLPGGAAASG